MRKVDEKLKQRNTKLKRALTINLKTGKEEERLVISTIKAVAAKPGTAQMVFATYCPFCGVKYEY